MAARRITKSSIDWAKIAERVPDNQKGKFIAFKAKSDGYLRRMLANPENPPKIDWSFYKSKVPVPALVDSFQRSYESLQIPYPKDTVSSLIDAQEKQIKTEIAAFKQESQARIVSYQKEIDQLNSLLPYEQMTMEEYFESHPERAYDPKNPTYWPHTPEEQPGYKGDDDKAASH